MQQFQEISQANEAALETLNNTYDDYKRTTEAHIVQLEVNFQRFPSSYCPTQVIVLQSDRHALEEKLQAIKDEETKLKKTFADAELKFGADREAWLADKKTLEDTIVDLTTSEKAFTEDRLSRESAVQQQEERVKVCDC